MNVKNTIVSTSSKKTSNNTSCLVSTSSRNASITPRKIATKVMNQRSPEETQALGINRIGKSYVANSKIQRNNLKPKAVKLNNKHKIIKEKSIRASSGSNRIKFIKNKGHLNNTSTKIAKGKEHYNQIIPELRKHDDLSIPMMIKNRPTTGVYGSMKSSDAKDQILAGFRKKKDSFGYNAHPHSFKKGGGTNNRSILKAKMEIRTNSDSNNNEYNLILGNPEKRKMIFSPVDERNMKLVPHSKENINKPNSLK